MVVVGKIRKLMTARGYGFIETEPPSEDIFFHTRALVDMDISQLREGDAVEFVWSVLDGRARAVSVKKIQGVNHANPIGSA